MKLLAASCNYVFYSHHRHLYIGPTITFTAPAKGKTQGHETKNIDTRNSLIIVKQLSSFFVHQLMTLPHCFFFFSLF